MQKKYLLFACFAYCLGCCYAQDLKNLGFGSSWNRGYIVFYDGVRQEGVIRNNDKEGVISFRSDQDSISQSVRTSQIVVMEYFDLDRGMKRKFASLETKDVTTRRGEEDIQLYEIIREFDDFAVLSLQDKVYAIESKSGTVSYSGNGESNSRMILSQLEVIYFINKNAEREIYMLIERREVDGLFDRSKIKGKVPNSSLPAKYMGERKWNEIKLFLRERSIKVNTKASLLEMLDYYASIKNEK